MYIYISIDGGMRALCIALFQDVVLWMDFLFQVLAYGDLWIYSSLTQVIFCGKKNETAPQAH
jgi:hypothetical protein